MLKVVKEVKFKVGDATYTSYGQARKALTHRRLADWIDKTTSTAPEGGLTSDQLASRMLADWQVSPRKGTEKKVEGSFTLPLKKMGKKIKQLKPVDDQMLPLPHLEAVVGIASPVPVGEDQHVDSVVA